MSRTDDVIGSFGGHQYRDCYRVLCVAIEVGKRYQPECPPMKVIWLEVCEQTGKKPGTVARALARAIEDLWNFGVQDKVIEHCHSWKNYRPSPKEFVFVFSRLLWREENDV